MNVAWVVLHCNRRIGARERRQLIPHVRFQVPFLGPESQLKSGFACAGLLCSMRRFPNAWNGDMMSQVETCPWQFSYASLGSQLILAKRIAPPTPAPFISAPLRDEDAEAVRNVHLYLEFCLLQFLACQLWKVIRWMRRWDKLLRRGPFQVQLGCKCHPLHWVDLHKLQAVLWKHLREAWTLLQVSCTHLRLLQKSLRDLQNSPEYLLSSSTRMLNTLLLLRVVSLTSWSPTTFRWTKRWTPKVMMSVMLLQLC